MLSFAPRTLACTVSSILATLLSAAPAHAQIVGGQWETLWQFDGQASSDYLGISASGAGDVDGDGFDDLIVGAWLADPGGLTNAGSAYVYSGATGGLIWRFDGQAYGDGLGYSVSGAGDVDGDGFDDVIVGARYASPGGLWDAGSAYVYSGATGSLIWQFDGQASGDQLGFSVSGAGDVDGDGFDDLIVGVWGADPGGRPFAGSAYVHSGATGSLIWQFDGQRTGDLLGRSVSGAGDVDGDGFDDVIVGAYAANPGGLSDAGSAYVYSGATGNLIWQFDGQADGDVLGWSVSGAGDVDGDGYDDVIVGAVGAEPGGWSRAGSAYVASGATGNLIWQFDGQASGDELGTSVSGAGDVDGDGFDDLIVGAYWADPGGWSRAGSAYVYSGATGNLIWQFDGQASGDVLGYSVSGAGDVDGDGFDDVIVGAPSADPGGLPLAGSAYVYSLDPFLQTSADSISASGGGTLQFALGFPASEAGARYAMLASLAGTGPTTVAGLDIPLTQDALFNRLSSGNAPPALQGAFGTLDVNAQAQATLQAGPALAPAIGRTIHFAAVTFDTGPAAGRMSSIVRYVQIVP